MHGLTAKFYSRLVIINEKCKCKDITDQCIYLPFKQPVSQNSEIVTSVMQHTLEEEKKKHPFLEED